MGFDGPVSFDFNHIIATTVQSYDIFNDSEQAEICSISRLLEPVGRVSLKNKTFVINLMIDDVSQSFDKSRIY